MKLNFHYSLILLFLFYSDVFAINDEITLNGLIGDKAIVMVKGKPEIYSEGQIKHGIKLIQVKEESAIFELNGKRTTLQMIKFFGNNSSITKEVAAMDSAKTHFISVELIFQTWDTMTYEIDYYYDGSFGSYVTLIAKPYFLGNTSNYWIHPYTKVLEGRHTVTLTIRTHENASGEYLSDEILFEILWGDEKSSGVAAEHRVKVIKEWTQQVPQS